MLCVSETGHWQAGSVKKEKKKRLLHQRVWSCLSEIQGIVL